jgi:hypothetical protein
LIEPQRRRTVIALLGLPLSANIGFIITGDAQQLELVGLLSQGEVLGE